MPRGKKPTGSLAALERELHALNTRRHAVVQEIKSLVEQLSLNVAPAIARLSQAAGLGADLPTRTAGKKTRKRRNVSAAGRAKLRALAKARWAAAKKAGKTRLG